MMEEKEYSIYWDQIDKPRGPRGLWEHLTMWCRIPSPAYATSEEWYEWEQNAKKNHPIKHLLSQILPIVLYRAYRNFIYEPYVWVLYRTTQRNHVINIRTLTPGSYDIDVKMLHSNFQLLVDFVEIDYNHEWYNIPKWKRLFKNRRNAKAGIDQLEHDINSLDCQHGPSPTKSDLAREIKELYLWWTVERPARWNPWEAKQIWDEYNTLKKESGQEECRFPSPFGGLRDQASQECYSKALERAQSLDVFYREEDHNMLLRLVKIHGMLWV